MFLKCKNKQDLKKYDHFFFYLYFKTIIVKKSINFFECIMIKRWSMF
jgi:hypothetical protein